LVVCSQLRESGESLREERRRATAAWREKATIDVDETPGILADAKALVALGIKSMDALHVACAIASGCEYFVTTDDLLLERGPRVREIRTSIRPGSFVRH